MKKLILLVIFITSVVSCELLDPKGWEEAHQERVRRGERCYEDRYGNFYCENTKEEKIYI